MSDDTQNANNDGGGIFGTPLSFTQGAQTQPTDDQGSSEPVKENQAPQETVPSNFIGVPITPLEEEPKEDDLISMGVTFVSDEAPKQEKNIFSKDSSFKDKEQEQISPILKQTPSLEPKTPELTKETPVKTPLPPVDTKDLEADFSKTFNTPVGLSHEDVPEGQDPIALEEQKLKRLHKELKDKAGSKKIVVKERLEKLRKEKESLGKELEEIKELELIASKIEEKLKNLEAIDSEIDSLEEQAHKELVS
jgi:hypothetical protein